MKIAFVTPFYGAQAAGGAESECRNTALRLAKKGINVDILTTCLRDLQHDWNIDAHPVGVTDEDGLSVHRFKSEKIDPLTFAHFNAHVMSGDKVSNAAANQFAALHINSIDLYRHLADHTDDYDWVCFIPYLFGTSIYGSKICPEKTILIPCLHNEGYARLAPVRDMFKRAARIVFHTTAEEQLGNDLYGETNAQHHVIGEGVETHLVADAERFRNKYGIDGSFALYCGRKDTSKNTDELVAYFTHYSQSTKSQTKLLLIGPGTIDIPKSMKGDIVDLGFIPHQDKLDAYAASSVFCQPSLNESFSLVLMEAWDIGRPALVNEKCHVLRDHVVNAGGGLYYRNAQDFAAALTHLLSNPKEAETMAACGQAYVRNNYSWPRIIDLYSDVVFSN